MMNLTHKLMLQSLVDSLGPTLAALVAGAESKRFISDYLSNSEFPEPNNEILHKIATAYVAWNLLAQDSGDNIARAFFIGVKQDYNDQSLVELIRGGHTEEALRLVQRYCEGVE